METNTSVELIVPPHSGSFPFYTWDFGDTIQVNTTDNFTTYNWTIEGVYQVILVAENRISNETFEVFIFFFSAIQIQMYILRILITILIYGPSVSRYT